VAPLICRFRNEMELMRTMLKDRMEVTIVKIVNPRVPVNMAHQSESEVYGIPDRDFDRVIYNTLGFNELDGHITLLANRLLPQAP